MTAPLQRMEFEEHPTSFFLSGGGGADLYDLKIDPSKRGPYGQKVYGFSHLIVTCCRFLLAEGSLQNQDGVIHVKATRLSVLSDRALDVRLHNFH